MVNGSRHVDQRIVSVQTKPDKRRQKRRGKKLKKAKLGLLTRVVSLFREGKIRDFTHQREVDPFWSLLYRQYERLTFLEIQLKIFIKRTILRPEQIDAIAKLFSLISDTKKRLLFYMVQALEIQYAAAVNSRFYGWKRYYSEFKSLFTEIALSNIARCTFDCNKTRPSVYFYQAFWLGGLSITGDVMQVVNQQKELEDKYKRLCKDKNAQQPEEILEDTNISAGHEPSSNSNHQKQETEEDFSEPIKDDYQFVLADEVVEDACPFEQIDTINRQTKAQEVVAKLLYQCGFPPDVIAHSQSKRELLKLARTIKRKLKNGEIRLSDQDKQVIETIISAV